MWIQVVLLVVSSFAGHPAQKEITLYGGDGTPSAYIAVSSRENPIVYLWSGEPVAYLESGAGNGVSIYGFNGKHLGWLAQGVTRDGEGKATCGIRDVVSFARNEPIKSAKQI